MLHVAVLSLIPRVRVAAPLARQIQLSGGRHAIMTASLEAPTAAPKSFDELQAVEDQYVLQRTEEVAERGISISMYTHEATGAQVMLVDAPDANKVFSANFRTLPKDNTGGVVVSASPLPVLSLQAHASTMQPCASGLQRLLHAPQECLTSSSTACSAARSATPAKSLSWTCSRVVSRPSSTR